MRFAVAAFLSVALLASCESSSTNQPPSGPSPTVTIRSVTVVLVASGTGYQGTAVAASSDGSSRDVSAEAQWSSTDGAVASVASNGLVTPLGPGTTEIRATFQSVSGSAQLVVSAPPSTSTRFTLTGVVRDATTNAALADAQAEIVDGADNGKTASTDSTGTYRFTQLTPGAFRLFVRKSAYGNFSTTVTLSQDQSVNVQLTAAAAPPPATPPVMVTSAGTVRDSLDDQIVVDGDGDVRMIQEGRTEYVHIAGTGTFSFSVIEGRPFTLETLVRGYADQLRNMNTTGNSSITFSIVPLPLNLAAFLEDADEGTPIVCPGRATILTGTDAGRFGTIDGKGAVTTIIPDVQPGVITVRASAGLYTPVEKTLRARGTLSGRQARVGFVLCNESGNCSQRPDRNSCPP